MKRKITGLLILAVFISMFSVTGCYKDDEARVTIHIERNDLIGQKPVQKKWFIDRILEFFSSPAYGGSTWSDVRTDLKLYVTSSSFNEMIFTIPANATEFSAIIPSANNVTFLILSEFLDSGTGKMQKNWGGKITLDISPGEQNITIKMIPMTFIWMANCCNSIEWASMSSPPSNASSYKIYRVKDDPNGNYTYIKTDSIGISYDTDNPPEVGTYYYKISVYGSDGEGVLSDPSDAITYTP